MLVSQIKNSIFNSNTYILSTDNDVDAWVVDPGDSEPILSTLESLNKYLKGILITHSHFDHIYGINNLLEKYPDVKILSSVNAVNGFYSEKENGSLYMEMPFTINCHSIEFLKNGDEIRLFRLYPPAEVIYTPGHNNDCLSFIIGKYIFTGDALLPNTKIHTKSRNSNKDIVFESIELIISKSNKFSIICPGHGSMASLTALSTNELFIH